MNINLYQFNLALIMEFDEITMKAIDDSKQNRCYDNDDDDDDDSDSDDVR